MRQSLSLALLFVVMLGFSSCVNMSNTASEIPLQGDTIPESTPVLYVVYARHDSVCIREHPSADSLTVERVERADMLEVIGERSDWLEVKMRTIRSTP